MSDFDKPANPGEIFPVSPEKREAARRGFDLEASVRRTEEQAAREEAEAAAAKPEIIVPAEETPDDAPPL